MTPGHAEPVGWSAVATRAPRLPDIPFAAVVGMYARYLYSKRGATIIKRWLIRAATAVALGSILAMPVVSTADGAPLAYLGYEDSRWESDTECCRRLFDPWNSNVFTVRMQGSDDYRDAWISPTIANEGRRSFGAWLRHHPTLQEKQRVEFEIANRDYYTQYLEQARYYGVAVYIHPQSPSVLSRGAVFMQTWQYHDTTYSKEPPFSLRFKDGSDYKWLVNVSKDVPGVDTRYTDGTKETIYTSPSGLANGVWHEFIVWFKPSTNAEGAVRVWHNGTLAVSQTNQRNFGYAPRATSPVMEKSFAVRYGACRTSVPDQPGDIILLFDQGKYGTSYESVDP